MTDTYAVNPGWEPMLASLGLDPIEILRVVGLPEDLFGHQRARIAASEYMAIWRLIEAELDDPAMPVTFIRNLSAELFEPPIFAALCAPNLAVAARRIAEFKPLVGPLHLHVVEDESALVIRALWPEDPPPPRSLLAGELLFWVGLARMATREEVEPIAMRLPVEPTPSPAYREYAGCEFELGPHCEIVFPRAVARKPFLTRNNTMWDFFEPELRRRLADLDAGAPTADRVRAVLLELLPAGEAGMAAVGKRLGMSTRTLQRRLRAEDTTFQACVARTREKLALHYLTKSAMSASEISYLLGYADPNSFYRAFHAWTGTTPEQARSAARA